MQKNQYRVIRCQVGWLVMYSHYTATCKAICVCSSAASARKVANALNRSEE
jgi:hypothetical protein